MPPNPANEVYERCVAAFAAQDEFCSDVLSVTPNAKIKGSISGRSRQVDVLVEDMRYSPKAGRLIVDAKRRSRRIDIKDVESFEGMIRDCEARRGIIVCTGGATSSAIRRAQDFITITVLSYEDALDYEWTYEPCLGHCATFSGRQGMVLWSELRIRGLGPGWLMYKTGKCDSCGAFHVWCSDCGSYLSLSDGRVVRCGCDDREWGSIPESTLSQHEGNPHSTWLMLKYDGQFDALDRKPIGRVKQQITGLRARKRNST